MYCVGPLQPATKRLQGPNSECLPVQGMFMGKLRHEDTEVMEEVYVVPGAHLPLLGCMAMQQ